MGIPVTSRISKSVLRLCVCAHRMMSSSSVDLVWPSRISPCLILNPEFKEDDMLYRFYSLKSQSVRKWKKRNGGEDGEMPADASKIVGSSHGWLALFNESNNDLFVSDPLNRRHIKLPSIATLPDPEINFVQGRGTVSKLILSCSPDDDERECRAMMTYGAGERLAFCSPTASGTDWIPLGDTTLDDSACRQAQLYQDLVYCSRQKVFTCITPSFKISTDEIGIFQEFRDYKCRWEDWDISPSPSVVASDEFHSYIEDDNSPGWAKEMKRSRIQTSHLLYVEELDHLFLVVRFVDGLPIPFDPFIKNPYSINDPFILNMYEADFPYDTVGFIVIKVNKATADGTELAVVDSLDGLAMFVGVNHSFAIPASQVAELNLKPNSIYFTDVGSRIKGPNYGGKYGGYDIGVFDYQNNTISRCCQFFTAQKKLQRVPLWFTPNIDLD